MSIALISNSACNLVIISQSISAANSIDFDDVMMLCQ